MEMTFNDCVQILIAVGTIGATVAAVYNARVAWRIATRKKEQSCEVICKTGLIEVLPNGEYGVYYETKSESNTYKTLKAENNVEAILRIKINNNGELPVIIEQIFIEVGHECLILNTLTDINGNSCVCDINIGYSNHLLFPFKKFETNIESNRLIRDAIKANKIVNLCVETSFGNKFISRLPQDFLTYIDNHSE